MAYLNTAAPEPTQVRPNHVQTILKPKKSPANVKKKEKRKKISGKKISSIAHNSTRPGHYHRGVILLSGRRRRDFYVRTVGGAIFSDLRKKAAAGRSGGGRKSARRDSVLSGNPCCDQFHKSGGPCGRYWPSPVEYFARGKTIFFISKLESSRTPIIHISVHFLL